MTIRKPNLPPRRSTRDGFIIVAVLWILIILATFAAIYSIYINNSAWAVSVMDDSLQAEALCSASLELTAYRLSDPKNDTQPTHGRFNFRLARARVSVSFSSEAARLDLNAAPRPLLTGFFAALGASDDDAAAYANRIVGWRTAPTSRDDEASLYRAAGLPYQPRGAPFADVSELWLVQSLPASLVKRAIPLVTVYSGRPDINVFDAPPELIAALPGMTPVRLKDFLSRREAAVPDKDSIARLLGSDQLGATAEGSRAYRVNIDIAFDKGWRTKAQAVILLDTASEPFHVLLWQTDLDADDPDQPSIARARR